MSKRGRARQKPEAKPARRGGSQGKGKRSGGLAFASNAVGEAARTEHAEAKTARPARGGAGAARARKPKPGTRVGKKGLVLYVDPQVPPALRRLALEHNCDVQQMGRRALELLFAEYGRVLPGGALPAGS